MRPYRRRYRPAPKSSVLILLLLLFALPAWSADKTRLRVDDYQIDAELSPHTHKISAKAKVRFTALDSLSVATFELNNALRLTKVTDANGKTLSAERVTQDSTVRIPLTAGMNKDASTTMTFEYEGIPGHVLLETVTFEDRGGKTTLTDQAVFQTVADRDGMLKSGMEEGAAETMDRLANLLKSRRTVTI